MHNFSIKIEDSPAETSKFTDSVYRVKMYHVVNVSFTITSQSSYSVPRRIDELNEAYQLVTFVNYH